MLSSDIGSGSSALSMIGDAGPACARGLADKKRWGRRARDAARLRPRHPLHARLHAALGQGRHAPAGTLGRGRRRCASGCWRAPSYWRASVSSTRRSWWPFATARATSTRRKTSGKRSRPCLKRGFRSAPGHPWRGFTLGLTPRPVRSRSTAPGGWARRADRGARAHARRA
jgi:hypothetical protein